MSAECVDCGGEVQNKDNAGHYRDRCEACQQKVANEVEPAGPIEIDPERLKGGGS